jgi:hypothetical protein|nr:MAG TPA: hypothetical protein [Caudoviricetes sp.]
MLKTNDKMYLIETTWGKTIHHLCEKVDNNALYYYTARDEVFFIIKQAYIVQRDYCAVRVSHVCKK